MINNINTYVKEGIIVAHETSYGKDIRPFDIVLANTKNKYENIVLKFMNSPKEYNICGIIVNKNILKYHETPIGNIYNSDLYVWYTTPLQINNGIKLSQELISLEVFKEKYKDTIIKKMKNNILDEYYISNIRNKMTKIFDMYNSKKYDYSIIKIIGNMFKCTDLLYKILGINKTKGISNAELIGIILLEFGKISINPEFATINNINYENNEIGKLYI